MTGWPITKYRTLTRGHSPRFDHFLEVWAAQHEWDARTHRLFWHHALSDWPSAGTKNRTTELRARTLVEARRRGVADEETVAKFEGKLESWQRDGIFGRAAEIEAERSDRIAAASDDPEIGTRFAYPESSPGTVRIDLDSPAAWAAIKVTLGRDRSPEARAEAQHLEDAQRAGLHRAPVIVADFEPVPDHDQVFMAPELEARMPWQPGARFRR